ncbi:MAG: calcium-binding protein [Gammaproteobacteria bacterium]
MKPKNRRLPRISKARLEEMIEEATVDAYNESEQITGWFTMIGENLAVPFETTVLGVPVTVERVGALLFFYDTLGARYLSSISASAGPVMSDG